MSDTDIPATEPQFYETHPFLLAVEKGDREAVRAFIDVKVDLEIQNTQGHTALNLACFKGDLDMVMQLHCAGASIQNYGRTHTIRKEKRLGAGPLQLAVYQGYVEVVDYLLNALQEINVLDKNLFRKKCYIAGIFNESTTNESAKIIWPARATAGRPNKKYGGTNIFAGSRISSL